MIALIALLAAVAPAPTSGSPQTSQPAYDTVTDPNWISVPSKSMMLNCTTGYLTDPKIHGRIHCHGLSRAYGRQLIRLQSP